MRTLRAAALFAAVTAIGAASAAISPALAGAGAEGAAIVAEQAHHVSASAEKNHETSASAAPAVRIQATWTPDGKGHISTNLPDATDADLDKRRSENEDGDRASPLPKAARNKGPVDPMADKGLTADVMIPADLPLSLDGIPGGKKALLCLAMNDYFEARSEDLNGRLAVAKVVMNRLKDRRFPRSVCGVVMEKKAASANSPRVCQFSWHCDGQSDTPTDDEAWRQSLLLAAAVLFGGDNIDDPSKGALWFHQATIRPQWDSSITRFRRIGNHVFYHDTHAEPDQMASLPQKTGDTDTTSRRD